jgi:hypothetical protein
MLLEKLKNKAIEKKLLKPEDVIDIEKAYELVRDMPYARASSRDPEITIEEWCGTCSGKHYLLKGLFSELGYSSRLIACTTESFMEPKKAFGKLKKLLKQSNGRIVDVHNYLILDLPDGEMIVDATWPVTTKGMGTIINEEFVLGQDQKIADEPIRSWVVPDDKDSQEFKNEILKESFSPEELEHRDEIIKTISKMSNSKLVKFIVRIEKLVKGKYTR